MTYPTELTGQEVWGVYVHEPGSLVSNFAIAFTCLILLSLKGTKVRTESKPWLLFITCIGIGATGGMIVHGFPTYLSELGFYLIWGIKNSFVPLANYFAAIAILGLNIRGKSKAHILFQLKALLVIVLLFVSFDFLPAVIDLAFTYVFVLARCFSKNKPLGSELLKWAFILALLSGTLYLFPFRLADGWFTNKDAVHVFVIVSLVIISSSIKEMHSI